MRAHRIIAAMIGALLVTGCGGGPDDRPEERPPTPATEASAALTQQSLLRGHATFRDGVHELQPCGAEEALWISAGGELLGESEARFDVFVVVEATPRPAPTEGAGADHPGAVEIDYVLYGGNEGPGCDFEWDSFHYRARGNEPFWMLEVAGMPDDESARRLRFVRPEEGELLMGGFVLEKSPDGSSIRIGIPPEESERSDPNPELVLRRARCRDTMSGAYFGLSARFVFRGQTFTGCALVGEPPPGDATGS